MPINGKTTYTWKIKDKIISIGFSALNILTIIKDKGISADVEEILLSKHQVITVNNSTDAIAILKSKNIDMVITEVNIGVIDGWRLARFIRTGILSTRQDVPIILLTENYCERIAETTARLFDITRVLSIQEISQIEHLIQSVQNNIDCLTNLPRILVVEDTEDTATLIERMLQHKFSITLASDGIKGLAAYREHKFDIVLLDIQMPGMSGDQVLDEIITINPNQVVIVMTAHGTADLAELMLVKGASDYIQKPFKAEQLRKVCDIAIKREDFIVSNEQFSAKTVALLSEQEKYDSLSKTHSRILDSLNSVVIELTPDGRISFLNQAWMQSTGFMLNQTIGRLFTDFIHHSNKHLIRIFEQALSSINFHSQMHSHIMHEPFEVKITNNRSGYFWCEVNLAPFYHDDGQLAGIAGTIDNISVRKKAEENLKHIALHDTLTGLRNRYYFDNELKKIADISNRTCIDYALLYIDLDHFKVINDTQGHHQGDLVLKEVAKLLTEIMRVNDVLCRIGGDEFAILLTKTNLAEAEVVAQDVCETVANCSFQFDEQVYKVSCSIGISEINGKEPNANIYLQQADIAMFAAKEKGRNRFHTFQHNDEVTHSLKQSFDWVQKIHSALLSDDITMQFQPVFDLQTREVAYYEALVRLLVDGQMVFPGDFIPSLEKAEDMNLLDRHVIGKTFSLMHQYPELECVAINLSAQVFIDDTFLSFVQDKMYEYQIKPARIIFELTESASLSNITATQRMVNNLNELGCAFSIDDFGTGFSTFSYLKQIPAESVKIDGSFVKDMLDDPTDAVLVKAIHETAIALNKKTVAEFVENQDVLDKLIQLGVHYAQGYYLGKPMDLDKLEGYLNQISTQGTALIC